MTITSMICCPIFAGVIPQINPGRDWEGGGRRRAGGLIDAEKRKIGFIQPNLRCFSAQSK